MGHWTPTGIEPKDYDDDDDDDDDDDEPRWWKSFTNAAHSDLTSILSRPSSYVWLVSLYTGLLAYSNSKPSAFFKNTRFKNPFEVQELIIASALHIELINRIWEEKAWGRRYHAFPKKKCTV